MSNTASSSAAAAAAHPPPLSSSSPPPPTTAAPPPDPGATADVPCGLLRAVAVFPSVTFFLMCLPYRMLFILIVAAAMRLMRADGGHSVTLFHSLGWEKCLKLIADTLDVPLVSEFGPDSM